MKSSSSNFEETNHGICCEIATHLSLLLYYTFICALGLTLLITLIYGLTLSNDTVSHNMLTYIPYRIVLSTCIFLQMGVWTLCLYSKRAMDPNTAIWGFLTMGLVICSWVGLSTVLTGTTHIVFVITFMASFFTSMLILCHLTWQEEAGKVLRLSLAFVLVCVVAMTILFNQGQFYIMEHVAFISYSLVFMAFFLVHPPSDWDVLPENHPSECELGVEIEWHSREDMCLYSATDSNGFHRTSPIMYSMRYN